MVLAGIELPLSGLIQQTTKKKRKKKKEKKKNRYFFLLPRKQDLTFMQWRQFEWTANLVFLEEWEKYFKMSSVENFSQTQALWFAQTNRAWVCAWRNLRCHVRRDGSARTLWACTSVLWSEPSLIVCTSAISGFNKMSCATSEDSGQSAQLHILIKAFADRIYLR